MELENAEVANGAPENNGAGVVGSSKTMVPSYSKAMSYMSDPMVYARQLNMGSDPGYWRWHRLDGTSEEVAELVQDYPLNVSGDYELKQLNPGTYAVFFVIMMQDAILFKKATLTLVDPDDAKKEYNELLTDAAVKKWFNWKVGEFQLGDCDAQGDKKINFSMTSNDVNWKGVIIRGVLIRQIV